MFKNKLPVKHNTSSCSNHCQDVKTISVFVWRIIKVHTHKLIPCRNILCRVQILNIFQKKTAWLPFKLFLSPLDVLLIQNEQAW